MRSVLSIILIYSLAITPVFAQSVNPNDTLKIGNKSSSSDKGITFDTNDGVNNKKLLVEKISKKLKWDGNSVQIGDGSSSSDKELVIAGALKSLKYNGTTGEFEFNDDLKLSGELKSDILRAINTEVAVKSLLRAEQGIKVGTGSNEIRVNAGNLEFSNDGVLYKKFGSGTGTGGSGGFNLITNDSFEDGIGSPWTSSGGTFTQETYAVGFEGNTKYARFVASGAGQYVEQIVSVPTSFSGGCQADFKKVNVSTAGLFKVQALDASDNVLAEQTIGVSSWVKVPTFGFPCPTSGTNNLKLRMISISAGTIDFDLGYIGSNQNIVNISQARLLGTIKWTATASCLWQTTSTTFTSVSANAACPSPVVTGSITAPSTKVPVAVLNNAQPGEYVVIHRGSVSTAGSTAVRGYVRPTDGTNFDSIMASGANSPGYESATPNVISRFSYATAQASLNFQLQLRTEAVNTPVSINAQSADYEIDVYFYPSSSEVAVSPEQSSWLIDANIGGGNPVLGGATSTYTEITGANLDLVINNSKGSASAEIACPSGTSSTGLTCASSESVGIAFIPPMAGSYEACFTFSTNSTNGDISVFQIVETPNNSTTILQEGGERIQSGFSISSGNTYFPYKLCGTFNFSDTSKRTLRVMYEKSTSNTTILVADRSGTAGQRDIKVTVRPVLSPYNRPILTGDQITTPGAAKPIIASGLLTIAPAMTAKIGDFVSTCTSGGADVTNCDFTPGFFLGTPNCSATPTNIGGSTEQSVRMGVSSTGLTVRMTSNNAANKFDLYVICHGLKP